MNVSFFNHFNHSIGLTTSDLGKTIGGKAVSPLDQRIAIVAAAVMLVIAAGVFLYVFWQIVRPRTTQEKVSKLCTDGILLRIKGNNEEAKLKYKEALKKDPKDIEALIGYGDTFSAIGSALTKDGKADGAATSFAKAEKQYKKALGFDSENIDALNAYGRFLKDQGKDTEAAIQFAKVEEQYKKALEANPEDVKTLDRFGWFLQMQKKYAEAVPLYQKLSQIDPKAFNFDYGSALLFVENYAEAEIQFKKSFEMNPKSDITLQTYIGSVFIQGHFAEAEKLCKKGFELFPKATSFWIGYANILCKQGRFDEAEAELKKCLKANPNDDKFLENYNKFIIMKEKWKGQSIPDPSAVVIEPTMTIILFHRICLHP